MEVALELQNVTVSYGNSPAVDNLSLKVRIGELVVLLGPSGSGKTTILSVIAGINPAMSALKKGKVVLLGNDITNVPPYRRNLGFVFQQYLLFEHMTVYHNVAFGLVERKVRRSDITRRVPEILDLVGLSGLEDRYPRQLSGGQQQRVALARALITEPDVLLLDEPLGSLDRPMRDTLQREIRMIHEERRCTTVYVTHDQEEAFRLGDVVAILRGGVLEQQGSPLDIYRKPRNQFVAKFLGLHNILEGVSYIDRKTDCRVMSLGDLRFPIPGQPLSTEGNSICTVIHPEAISYGRSAQESDTILECRVRRCELVTGTIHVYAETPGGITFKCTAIKTGLNEVPRVGEKITIGWDVKDVVILDD